MQLTSKELLELRIARRVAQRIVKDTKEAQSVGLDCVGESLAEFVIEYATELTGVLDRILGDG